MLTATINEATVLSAEMKLLELMTENAELRTQLAEAQDQCVELAVDAGELHAEIVTLRQELAVARANNSASSQSQQLAEITPTSGCEANCFYVSVASTGVIPPAEP